MTPKQQRFVEEYLVDLNATAAAKRAGYSVKTAEQAGHRALRNAQVSQAIAQSKAARAEEVGRSASDVLADIGKVRANCMQQVVDEQGVVSMLSHKEALRALELEGRHVGLFERDNKQRNPLGGFDVARFFGDIFRRPQTE